MGDYLKITQGSYNQIERGTKQPSIPIIEALTQLFNCTADELLFGEGTAVEGGETAK
jgi:transcriptional regulator with XRE-family HTH domain